MEDPVSTSALRPKTRPGIFKSLELLVEAVILSSRWLMVVFHFGLIVALGLYAIAFIKKLWKLAVSVLLADSGPSDTDLLLAMLGLVDAALIASLLVMVMLASYEQFVSRFDFGSEELTWLGGKLDAGSLKVKIGSSIVAISSIHLLQVFFRIDEYGIPEAFMLAVIHAIFVASTLMLALVDRFSHARG